MFGPTDTAPVPDALLIKRSAQRWTAPHSRYFREPAFQETHGFASESARDRFFPGARLGFGIGLVSTGPLRGQKLKETFGSGFTHLRAGAGMNHRN